MPAPISAQQRPIGLFFGGEYVFKIPGYQRPYAWTRDQASELFEDLKAALEDGGKDKPIEELGPYFLGSMVLIKAEERPEADVVDGQQRLTTLVLLLSAIRETLDGEEVDGITTLIYQKGNAIMGHPDRFRLELRPRDKEFFQTYVQREGGITELVEQEGLLSDSQINLKHNAALFLKLLEDMERGQRVRLAQYLLKRCYLVAVSTPDLDSAFRIFSVLNSRGLNLEATDILKAEIIGAIPEAQRDDYTEKWEGMEEDLGREGYQELISQIRTVYRKAKPKGTLLKEFKEHVGAKYMAKQLVDDVIEPMAESYIMLRKAGYVSTKGAEAVNGMLAWLNKLEFVDWLQPALAFSVRHKNNSVAMGAFFKDLERLAYGLLLMKSSPNERVERFSRLTSAIEAEENLSAKKSPLQLSRPEQERVYNALRGAFYDDFAARARTLVLVRLDALLTSGGATYDYPVISVEHVLPQTVREQSEWMEWIPDEGDRLTRVHQLGNLALLTRKKNSAASNYDFERKKSAYFAGRGGVVPFPLTTQVLKQSKWGTAEIDARQAELLALFEKHWRLEERQDFLQSVLSGDY
jgi:hypothetical protein